MNLICTACGASLKPDSRFCHACGARLPELAQPSTRYATPLSYTPAYLAQRILTSRSALEGEHKRVTVLFCDIANSTVMAERLGEERMYELLNRFFDLALDEVHQYEGSVNQFLGDGFMALFGAPLALERHEQHAVLAGLALRRRLAESFQDAAREAGIPFEVRLGLNTGLVVVGKIGDNLRMDYTAVGDTTHVAARLQAMAAAGELLIAKSTFERVQSLVETRPLGLVEIKGKSAPQEVHRVIGPRSAATATPSVQTRALSRFVGRDREMADLLDCLDHAEAGRGQAIGIVSEAGMGKSRLLGEFRQRMAQRDIGFYEGQCLSYGASIPYLPILDIVRAACRIGESESPELVREKLRLTIDSLGMDADAATTYLLHLLGLHPEGKELDALSPEAIQTRTFETLRQLCLKASRRRALVLVIEDLHWVDRSSQDFIATLADSLAGAPILLIATYRPGFSPTWINKSYATQIALRPLAPGGAMAIVKELLASQGLPEHASQDIVTRAEGNPLFLEELARAISEDSGAGAVVPHTLQAVLSARIDRLPERAKELLQLASVIGREFSRRLLALIWDDDASLEAELARLTRLEFIYEQGSEAEAVHVFKHALTRDAAYASLLRQRKRACHSRVGKALEQVHAGRVDEASEILAHQFGQSDDDEKAVDYALRASARAQGRWANIEALSFFELALQRLQAMPASDANRLRKIDIVIKQAEVRFALGQHAAQLAALDQISAQILPSDDPSRRAAWHYWSGFLISSTGGRTQDSIDHCQKASVIAEDAHLEDLRASADTCLAQGYLSAGRLNEAIAKGERALEVFERRGNRWWACRALAQLSPAANGLGQWQRSLDHCERTMAHGVAMDDLRLKATAGIRMASTHIQRGDWSTGLARCEQAQALAPVQYDAAALRAVRGLGLIKSGRIAEGSAELSEALAWFDQAHLRYTQTLFTTWLIEGHLLSQDIAQALPLARAVLGTSEELGYRYLAGIAHRLIAECLLRGDAHQAAHHLQQSIATLQSLGARNELAKTWLVQAALPETIIAPIRPPMLRKKAYQTLRELGTAVSESASAADQILE